MTDTHEVFLGLVDGVRKLIAGDRSQVDRLAGLYAEQTDVVYAGAPEAPMHSREELRVHFSKVPEVFAAPRYRGFRAENINIHDDAADPEIIISEFVYVSDGDANEGDPPLHLPCCFVFRIRNGEIVASRDYILGTM